MITYEYFIIIFRFFKGNKHASTVLGYRPYNYADKQQCNAYQHRLNPILSRTYASQQVADLFQLDNYIFFFFLLIILYGILRKCL